MIESKKPLRLASLEEMEEMERLADGDMGDPYNTAYLSFLRRGMTPIHAHFEAIAQMTAVESSMNAEALDILQRLRAEFKEATKKTGK